MIKSFLYRILEKRHFWRYATFSEIADLYAAQTIRMISISLVSGFSSIFLYKQGYSVEFIMFFWATYFFAKMLLAPLAGIFLARFGTTTSTIISNILYVPALICLSLVPELKINALIMYAFCLCLSVTLHELCYYVNFSIVKNMEHAGKEIGFMNILQKLAIAISPVIGGLIALKYNVQVVMLLAGILLIIAGLPLLKIKNQSEKMHRIVFKGFPWRLVFSSLISEGAIGFDNIASATVWGLFLAIIVLPTAGNSIYVLLGALSSVTLLVSIITSAIFGRLIDESKGGLLLKVGVGINVIVHFSRALVTTAVGTVGINAANEVASTALGMSFMRGIFDIADSSGYRIVYIIIVEIIKNFGSVLACIIMAICAIVISGQAGFQFFFIITGLICSIVYFSRFQIYQK